MKLSITLFNPLLKTSVDGDSITSLRRLLQWVVVLTVKTLFRMLRWNFSWCNLHSLPLVSSTSFFVKGETPSSFQLPIKYWNTVMRSPGACSSPGRKDLTLSVFPCRQSSYILTVPGSHGIKYIPNYKLVEHYSRNYEIKELI